MEAMESVESQSSPQVEQVEARRPNNSPDTKNGETQVSVGDAVTFDDIEAATTQVENLSNRIRKKKSEKEEPAAGVEADAASEVSSDSADVKLKESKDASKKVKAIIEGKPSEIQVDSKVEVFIDQKPHEVPLADLMANYSGKVAWEKRFQELSNQRQNFVKEQQELQAEKAQVFDLMDSVASAVQDKNIDKLLFTAVKLQGKTDQEALKAVTDYYQYASNEIRKFEKMSPEARELHALKQKTEFDRRDSDRRAQFEQQKQQEQSLQGEVATILQEDQVSADEFMGYFNELKAIQAQNPDRGISITPQVVRDYRRSVIRWERAHSLAQQTASKEKWEDQAKIINQVIAQNPDFDDNDIKSLFSDEPQKRELTEDEKQVLKAKVQKSQPQKKVQASEAKQSKWASLTFDDL